MKDVFALLAEERRLLNIRINQAIDTVDINDLSDAELIVFFTEVSLCLTENARSIPRELSALMDAIGFNLYDTFCVERHQTVDYYTLIEQVWELEENDEYYKKDVDRLKRWAGLDDWEETQKKFEVEIIKIALSRKEVGFTFDW